MRKLKFIGVDDWDRPVYKDQKGRLWKDVNLGNGTPYLHNVAGNGFEGEPDSPITGEYEIIGKMEDYPNNSPCDTCDNAGWETMGKVAACNCCENHEFYRPLRKEPHNGGIEKNKKTK